MPRAGTNHVTSVASGWLLRRDAKPVTVNVPFGVQVLPERLLVASSSQFNPRKPAPGELRNGPTSCALAFGPAHVSVTGWSGSSRRTEISRCRCSENRCCAVAATSTQLPRPAARSFAIRFFRFSAPLSDNPSSRSFSPQLSFPGASRSGGLSALCSRISRFSRTHFYG